MNARWSTDDENHSFIHREGLSTESTRRGLAARLTGAKLALNLLAKAKAKGRKKKGKKPVGAVSPSPWPLLLPRFTLHEQDDDDAATGFVLGAFHSSIPFH